MQTQTLNRKTQAVNLAANDQDVAEAKTSGNKHNVFVSSPESGRNRNMKISRFPLKTCLVEILRMFIHSWSAFPDFTILFRSEFSTERDLLLFTFSPL